MSKKERIYVYIDGGNLYHNYIGQIKPIDGDLAPAVEMVTRKGKKVEIVGFEHKPSYSLIQKTNTYHSVKKSDLDKFMPEE